jgi:hypothetical protein
MESQVALPARGRAPWVLAAVLGTVLLALVPVVFEHRFYFADDTQAGAYGIWYSIGEHLRAGEIPLFEPSRWMAGNYAAEGQWGTFNPLVMVIGLLTYSVPNAVALVTGLKIAFLATAALGVHLLARSYGARPEWAAVGGVLAPTAGFVVYMDSASWVTGLMTWALLPSVWWALRRTATVGGNPLLPFVLGYLLITIGYVHGTLMLVVVIVGVLLEALLARSRRSFLSTLLVGVLLGLVAAAVYLPGVLSAAVTARDSAGVLNDNFLSPDLSGFAASSISTANPWISGFWAPPVSAPILYITWLLPALSFVDWHRARGLVVSTAGLWVVGVVALALVLGPAELGPLRFPVRLTPYVVLTVVVLLVVLLSRAAAAITRARSAVAVGIVVVGGYSAFAEQPGAILSFGAAAVLAIIGVLLVGRTTGGAVGRGRGPVALLTTVLAVTAFTVVLQHRVGRDPSVEHVVPQRRPGPERVHAAAVPCLRGRPVHGQPRRGVLGSAADPVRCRPHDRRPAGRPARDQQHPDRPPLRRGDRGPLRRRITASGLVGDRQGRGHGAVEPGLSRRRGRWTGLDLSGIERLHGRRVQAHRASAR